MDLRHDTMIKAVLEHLIGHGANDIGRVSGRLCELAMQIEREQFPGAGHYEHIPARQGFARLHLPTRCWRAGICDPEAFDEVSQTGETAPDHCCSGRRVAFAVRITTRTGGGNLRTSGGVIP